MKKLLICLFILGATAGYASTVDHFAALEGKIAKQLDKEINATVLATDYDINITEKDGVKSGEVILEVPSAKIRDGVNYDDEAQKVFKILGDHGLKNNSFLVESIVYEKKEMK